jgi:hypothetical protein
MTIRMSTPTRARSAAVFFSGLVSFSAALLAFESAASAQASPTPTAKPASKTPYDATVASKVEVRCAASKETGYVFGAIDAGATVRVLQEEAGWLRVATTGPAFDGWYGFVKASPGITLSADGTSIKVGSRAEITAVNSERDFHPDASYRAIGYLLNGDEATVVEQVKGEQGAVYYAVSLGTKTSGWIPSIAVTAPEIATTTTTTTPSSTTNSNPTSSGVVTTPAQPVVIEVDTETGQAVTADGTVITTETVVETETVAPVGAETETREQVVAKVKRVRVADLNAAYKAMRAEPTEMAEFEALRERCLAITEDPTSTRYETDSAKFLARKVAMDITIQKDLREIAERKRKLDSNFKGVADLELATLARMPYDNVGRLNASKFYTGERMPLLYVLQDPGTGYTIAYIIPGTTYDLSSMLGLLVGVKGPVRYDESLRLNVIAPNTIVPISPRESGSGAVTATGSENPATADK